MAVPMAELPGEAQVMAGVAWRNRSSSVPSLALPHKNLSCRGTRQEDSQALGGSNILGYM